MLGNGAGYEAVESLGLIIEVLAGHINFKSFEELKSAECTQLDCGPYRKYIVDLRSASIDIENGELFRIFHYFDENESFYSGKRAALLVSTPDQTVKGMILKSYEAESSFKSEVFSTVEAALLFLGLSDDQALIENKINKLIAHN